MSWAQCGECGATFAGEVGFDRHRVNMTGKPGYDPEYDWRCATALELLGKGWHQNGRGWWHRPGSPPARREGTRTA